MATMRAVQVSTAGGELELAIRDIPSPQAGEVLIKIEACGICHGDAVTKEGHHPALVYPRIPGHEILGGLTNWEPTSRAGRWGSALVSVGMADHASSARRARRAILISAAIC